MHTAVFEDEEPVGRVEQKGEEVRTQSPGFLLVFLLQDNPTGLRRLSCTHEIIPDLHPRF